MVRHWNKLPREVVSWKESHVLWKCLEGIWMWHLGVCLGVIFVVLG